VIIIRLLHPLTGWVLAPAMFLAPAVGLVSGTGGMAEAAVTFRCQVSTTAIAFGLYSPLNANGDAAAGSWTVICHATGTGSATVAGTLTLSTGFSGNYASRFMESGTNRLNYNIYLTPAYAQIIGNGTAGTYAPSATGTVTAGQAYEVTGTMYGYVPPAQDVAPGSYSDAIILTVTY
jgi:spore coat protein U-like protein